MRCDGNVFDSFQTLGTNDVLHALQPAGSVFFSSPSNQCVEQYYQQPRKLVETCQLSQIAAARVYASVLNSKLLKRK